jgi:hypothetical protein
MVGTLGAYPSFHGGIGFGIGYSFYEMESDGTSPAPGPHLVERTVDCQQEPLSPSARPRSARAHNTLRSVASPVQGGPQNSIDPLSHMRQDSFSFCLEAEEGFFMAPVQVSCLQVPVGRSPWKTQNSVRSQRISSTE